MKLSLRCRKVLNTLVLDSLAEQAPRLESSMLLSKVSFAFKFFSREDYGRLNQLIGG